MYDVLGELYGLGGRLLDSRLRNVIVDEMVRFTKVGGHPRCYPQADAVNMIYEYNIDGLPARRLLVFWFITSGKEDCITDDPRSVFLCDVAKA